MLHGNIEMIAKKPKTVIEYLEEVSYEDDPNYVPSDFALAFVNFIKLCNDGEGEENKTPVLHMKMLDQLAEGNEDIINMIFRGAAKTSIFAEYLTLYIAVFGEIPVLGSIDFMIYVSDSIDNGVKNLRKNLEFRRENSEFLMKYLPEAKFTDIHIEFTNISGRVLILKLYGAKTGIRGAKARGKRPQLAILDDLVSDEDAKSATIIATIEDTVNKALEHAMHPTKRRVIWSGTPFNQKDPLYKAVESGGWKVNVFPVCEKFPCTKEEFRGGWEDRFTYEAIKAKYDKAVSQGAVKGFYQELMLRIISDEDRLVPDDQIIWYNRKLVLSNLGLFNTFITTDWAVSEKQSADYTVVSVWAVDSAGNYYWVDGFVKQQAMNKSIDGLFYLVQKYKPIAVGVETTGQQLGFVSWIKEKMLDRRIFFAIEEIRPSNSNKFTRFKSITPLFETKKIHFPKDLENTEEMRAAKNQLELVTNEGFRSKNDDFLDTISMLGMMQIWYPSEELPAAYSGSTRWGYDPEFYEESSRSSIDSYIV